MNQLEQPKLEQQAGRTCQTKRYKQIKPAIAQLRCEATT